MMEDLVREFNSLPRPQTTPTGLPNHWVFRTRHVPLQPPGDLLIAVHPPSTFALHAGPAQILNLPSLPDKATAIVSLLLDAFIKGSRDPTGRQEAPAFAPWTWATDDQELAEAIQLKLRDHGVQEALCNVGLLQLGDASQCHHCRKTFSTSPKRCSACGKAYYCNRDCQKADWKRHKKPDCLANRSDSNSSASAAQAREVVDAHTYFNTVAHTIPEAQALARTLNLVLPSSLSPAQRQGTRAENMAMLFGPSWQESIQRDRDEIRLEVLLNPPRGSPSYAISAQLDAGGPTWSPRPATPQERARLDEVREMQAMIRQRVGSHQCMCNVPDDIQLKLSYMRPSSSLPHRPY
ncbi:uncharacterized protein MYCFIDRAFT_204223 [Pseudocercospora fijiensis CIRAD86]|uniref:MYND-type domain-containing protein n=1 Tax=Pseudocercospora fijiensis (strain CIRAD86) TaxID=383855 RepID=M3A982_PSEFD|nr:uncharacterized protein MYCFIDRAFT_204223 [Pseudocercospora fijiensis CIRAD86]EME81186.1 hypothetical protein MYCFIDRAFT_204223 [Pseudocercospora fijiensis CIRAD86]